jgi:hypothetical protein
LRLLMTHLFDNAAGGFADLLPLVVASCDTVLDVGVDFGFNPRYGVFADGDRRGELTPLNLVLH